MIPIIVLIGRPNVGKSALFNYLTQTKNSVVSNFPNTTCDRKYGSFYFYEKKFIIIDTASIYNIKNNIANIALIQTIRAIQESNIIFFVVDAKNGLVSLDIMILEILRSYNKPIYLIINKIDNLSSRDVKNDFYLLGISNIFPVNALNGKGINELTKKLIGEFCLNNFIKIDYLHKKSSNYHALSQYDAYQKSKNENLFLSTLNIKIAIIGRTNVGKSTLINGILGTNRVVVSDIPGTTHDSISVFVKKNGINYEFIDTAGVDKNWKLNKNNEKIFVLKTLKSINIANIVLIIFNANDGIIHQDLILLNYAIKFGRSIVIVINKIDIIFPKNFLFIKKKIISKLKFASFAKINFISALYNTGIDNLFNSIIVTYKSLSKHVNTSLLTRILIMAKQIHSPPIIKNRRINIKYAHAGGYNPFVLVIHGNQVNKLPDFYKRYLINYFRKKLNFVGVCIRIQCIENKNPYLY